MMERRKGLKDGMVGEALYIYICVCVYACKYKAVCGVRGKKRKRKEGRDITGGRFSSLGNFLLFSTNYNYNILSN